MKAAARLLGLATATLASSAPLMALAQAVDRPAAGPRNYGWIWLLVAAIVVVALFRMFTSRSRRPPPSPPTLP